MLIEDVERIIRTAPGLTATQIARKLYGSNGYGERVRALCQALHKLGRIERIGMGGPGEPFRFYPATDGAASPPELGNLGRPPIGSVVE
jgi:hypothetical protein